MGTHRRLVVTVAAAVLFAAVGASAPVSRASALADPEWLQVVNLYRSTALLPPVTERDDASAGAVKHSQYLLRNEVIGHGEDPAKPGYTVDGQRAGETGNVATGSGALVGERATIESWMTAPFHGLGMLDPAAEAFGYGFVSRGTSWAATLSLSWEGWVDSAGGNAVMDAMLETAVDAVLRAHPELEGRGYEVHTNGTLAVVTVEGHSYRVVRGEVADLGDLGPRVAGSPPGDGYPTVVWPGPGAAVPLVRYAGSEWPDPIVSCKGYTDTTTGLPILIRRGHATELRSVSLTDSTGAQIPTCTITAETYTNPNRSDQAYVREGLAADGAAIVLPKGLLVQGRRYRAVVETTDGERLDWTFSVAADSSVHPPQGTAMAGRSTPGRASQVSDTTPATSTTKKPTATTKRTKTTKAAKTTKTR